jgi:hypothetical protein
MRPVDVRSRLLEALRMDLVGPENGADLEGEVLPQAPSRWYLTGFLVPLEASEEQKTDETAQDEFDFEAGTDGAGDDDTLPETPVARRAFFPSSIGLSLLVSKETSRLEVVINWGDYRAEPLEGGQATDEKPDGLGRGSLLWRRTPRQVSLTSAFRHIQAVRSSTKFRKVAA